MNLQSLLATAVYEKITVVEVFHKEVTYFVRKPGVGGRAEYAGRLSDGLKLTETSQKRTRLSADEFRKGVDLCNRSYPGLGSVLTESETEIVIEGKASLEGSGSRRVAADTAARRPEKKEVAVEKKRRSTRSKPAARKKRQSESTDEESEEARKESPEKKRYKPESKPAFSFASLRINLSPNRKRVVTAASAATEAEETPGRNEVVVESVDTGEAKSRLV